ncbi:uncharacterized protein CMU_025710 [Cryptosporidium muris RN66]|uniref:Serine hydroxymethyltransferase-like domain-containing protein n=1 Tax=Cryptosporidium muris (strain RN66) TaxID=441375 RepID=B6AB12_CRYMR|nr:uncharacterized protein CMU_025710 [Cryptosporidium muris RN66]EEA05564.1 hypothetical protein, conserved [Cryptosporidium muris RN66]|eukprot:XP_002139913.1 hypothetical protein [Cryptosporidium muris RN66]
MEEVNVINNIQSLYFLQSEGTKIITNGTNSHILIYASIYGISEYKTKKLFEAYGIFSSKSSLPNDGRNMSYRVRIETTALTIRGLKYQDFQKITLYNSSYRNCIESKEGNKSIIQFIEALPRYFNLINPLKNVTVQYIEYFNFP